MYHVIAFQMICKSGVLLIISSLDSITTNKINVSDLMVMLTPWSYVFLALSHRSEDPVMGNVVPVYVYERHLLDWSKMKKKINQYDSVYTCIATVVISFIVQRLYLLSGRTSYHEISRSLEAARLDVKMIVSLWNLTDISATMMPMCLSNFRA